MTQTKSLREVGSRVEELLGSLQAEGNPAVAERAEELVRLLMELYGAGLERVLEIAFDGPSGPEVVDRLAEDKLLKGLLVLHGLHPVPAEERILIALDKVRPYLGSHAGGVEFLGLDEYGVAHLKLQGSCDGCPSSTITVKMAIERAIEEAAPEVSMVAVEGVAEPPPPPTASGSAVAVQIGRKPTNGANGNGSGEATEGWSVVSGLNGALPPGTVRAVNVDGSPVLICSATGNLYAYHNACPSCSGSLDDATLKAELLTCRGCGAAYNVQLAGKEAAGGTLRLSPLPLLSDKGEVRVAVPSGR